MTTLAHRERIKELAAAAEGFDKEALDAAYATACFWEEIGRVLAAIIRQRGSLRVARHHADSNPEDAARIGLLNGSPYVDLFLVEPHHLESFGQRLTTWGGRRLDS